MSRASELVRAMEEGKAVRKVLDSQVGNPQWVELRFFTWRDAGRDYRLVRLHANHTIWPASRNNYRSWLADLVEHPEDWEVVDG